MLLRKAKPRQFQFQTRYQKDGGDGERHIQFHRIRTYDPHNRKRMWWLLLLVILVGLMLYLFGPIVFPYLGGTDQVTIEAIDVP
jgi:hypothetical protein